MSKPDYFKICKVCSDKALGFNFNALTCESCKAFFRRNAHKREKLKCPFNENCKIDIFTRRFCQKCRLDKCFAIGMKKEWILSDDQKRIKRIIIEQNKLKRAAMIPASNDKQETKTDSSMMECQDSSVSNGLSMGDKSNQETNTMKYCQTFTSSNSFNDIYSNSEESKRLVENGEQKKDSLTTLLATAHQRIVLSNFTLNYLRMTRNSTCKPLNEVEWGKLNEIVAAFDMIRAPVFTRPYNEHSSYVDVAELTERTVRRLIKACKMLKGFRELCIEDQISLLKGGCIEMILMRSVLTYNFEENCWKDEITHLEFDINCFKRTKGLYEAHPKFIKKFNPRWRKDRETNLLLTAIVLFSPERSNLKHVEAVRLEQCTYIYLLQRYLESKSSQVCEARSALVNLLSRVEEAKELNEEHLKIYMEIDPQYIGPLLMELFNKKF